MSSAIETRNLSKSYPRNRRYRDLVLHPWRGERVQALDDVNLRLGRGELIALLGPNGAGKTTLIKILCTLVLPSSGTVLVDGLDPVREGRSIRRVAGLVVSEDRSFYWRLTGRQNLEFFAALNDLGDGRDRIGQLLELLELGEHADRMFKDYSSGLKQRLAIARAMLPDPQILFMDEPTRALDPNIARRVRKFVRDVLVGEQGRTVVFSTHNLFELDGMYDHLVILDRGRVRLSASAAEVPTLLQPEESHVLEVESDRDGLESLFRSRPELADGGPEFMETARRGRTRLRVRPRVAAGGISDIIAFLVMSGVRVQSCEREEPTLDEIFQHIVDSGAAERD